MHTFMRNVNEHMTHQHDDVNVYVELQMGILTQSTPNRETWRAPSLPVFFISFFQFGDFSILKFIVTAGTTNYNFTVLQI